MKLRTNVIYSSILTVSGYIFPFITFPYVTRVLGVEYFGLCGFFDSIITYFTLFSMMGISTLGIREIAKFSGDRGKLNQTYSSLFTLNAISTVIAIVVLLLSSLIVEKFNDNSKMIYIGCLKIVSNFLLIEWFYRGIENFKFITFRSIFIRSLYVISVFLFVKTSEDYVLYFLLTALMFTVNAVINMLYSSRFVSFSFRSIRLQYYIKPFVIFGAYQLLTSMYTSFNIAYLGFISGNTEVGYYSTSVKLFNILLSFYTAFTGVLLPRMSTLASDENKNEFAKLIYRSFNILFTIAIPIIVFSEIYTPEIVNIMSGSEYERSIIPMRIVMPLVLIIGIEQILVYQILIPLNQDKKVFINSTIGAIVGILANIILIPFFASVGSALVWVLSEVCVLVSSYCFVLSSIKVIPIINLLSRKLIESIPLVIILMIVRFFYSGISSLIVSIAIMFFYYLIIEMTVNKNTMIKLILPFLFKEKK